jgi:alpha-mannosidase
MAMYNNFITNFDNVDPGETLYRYSFSSYSGDSVSGRARDFGWNASNPPVALWMKGPQEGRLSSKESFFHIDASNVILLTFKKADDDNGYILRLMEMEGSQTQARLTLPILDIRHAYRTDLVEENPQELSSDSHSLTVTLQPFMIATIRIVKE